jgi:hypothetical protein
MRDGFVIFVLLLAAVIIGAWLLYYAPPSISAFPHPTVVYAPSKPAAQAAAVIVPFTELASGPVSNAKNQKNYAVLAKEDFADVWAATGKTPPAPAVDFSKQNVIAVFAGTKPTGGYAIKIEKVTDTADARVISIVMTEPSKNCVTSDVVTSPFEVVAVPASTLPPEKDVRVVTDNCQ